MKVSVFTPSIRIEGLKLVQKALKRQTYKNFEWIVCSPKVPEVDCIWLKDTHKGGYWTLNRAYNDLIEKAQGDLIISWQDYTFADPDCLEKFVAHFEAEPKTLVSAVGNKYTQIEPYPMLKVWQDPRESERYGSYYKCVYNDVEWNLSSIPKSALYDIGGFDERLDFEGFGMDGFAVNDRINSLGTYDFKIDQSIKSYSLPHDRHEDWDKFNLINGGWILRKQKLIDKGVYPKLNYLNLSEKEGLA